MGSACVSWWTWPSRRSSPSSRPERGAMARRTFDVIDVADILVHWHACRSLNEIAGSLGVDRKTLRKYVAPAVAPGIEPDAPARAVVRVGGQDGRGSRRRGW